MIASPSLVFVLLPLLSSAASKAAHRQLAVAVVSGAAATLTAARATLREPRGVMVLLAVMAELVVAVWRCSRKPEAHSWLRDTLVAWCAATPLVFSLPAAAPTPLDGRDVVALALSTAALTHGHMCRADGTELDWVALRTAFALWASAAQPYFVGQAALLLPPCVVGWLVLRSADWAAQLSRWWASTIYCWESSKASIVPAPIQSAATAVSLLVLFEASASSSHPRACDAGSSSAWPVLGLVPLAVLFTVYPTLLFPTDPATTKLGATTKAQRRQDADLLGQVLAFPALLGVLFVVLGALALVGSAAVAATPAVAAAWLAPGTVLVLDLVR